MLLEARSNMGLTQSLRIVLLKLCTQVQLLLIKPFKLFSPARPSTRMLEYRRPHVSQLMSFNRTL